MSRIRTVATHGAKYLVLHRRPPSQNWRTFLKNHMRLIMYRARLVPGLFGEGMTKAGINKEAQQEQAR
jgi:hypothetical protein